MPDNTRPNIVLFITDQQRADTVGCCGENRCRTPNLDELAVEGVRFDNAYTVCGVCSPARCSILTGRYPHNHRMWNNNDMMQWAVRDLSDSERLVSEDLVAGGYNCGYSGKWHCGERKLPRSFGFEGMDIPNYGHPYHREELGGHLFGEYLGRRQLKWPTPSGVITPWGGGSLFGPPEACEPCFVSDHAIEMIKRLHGPSHDGGKPFFQVVSFWGPHHPCFVPEPYASMYDPNQVQLSPSLRENLDSKPRAQKRHLLSNLYPDCHRLSDDVWRQLLAIYWGYCSFIDHEIGRVVEALKQMGVFETTAIIFCSDHGDMQGGHGLYDKGPFMYEEVYHIPLIIRIPGQEPKRAACNRLVSNMDIASTILDLANIAIPGSHDGRSLLPLVCQPDGVWTDDLMGEYHGGRFLCTQRMLRWDRYKYVFNANDIDELYDLESDPSEMINLANDPGYGRVAAEGRHRLLNRLERSSDPILVPAREMLEFWSTND
jgi:arylsulfatase A-like enzyme